MLNDLVLNDKHKRLGISRITLNKSISIDSSIAKAYCRQLICIDSKIIDFLELFSKILLIFQVLRQILIEFCHLICPLVMNG